jgi:hypothetical protein
MSAGLAANTEQQVQQRMQQLKNDIGSLQQWLNKTKPLICNNSYAVMNKTSATCVKP